jgi:hypothetical protein
VSECPRALLSFKPLNDSPSPACTDSTCAGWRCRSDLRGVRPVRLDLVASCWEEGNHSLVRCRRSQSLGRGSFPYLHLLQIRRWQ